MLWDREIDKPGAIQAGATNLTIFSTLIAAVGAGLVGFTGLSDEIIGPDKAFSHDVLRVVLLVAIIAAGALIVMADLFARSRVAAAAERSAHLFEAPDGLQAVSGGKTFDVSQIRIDGNAGGSAQVRVEEDGTPTWEMLDGKKWRLKAK